MSYTDKPYAQKMIDHCKISKKCKKCPYESLCVTVNFANVRPLMSAKIIEQKERMILDEYAQRVLL